MTRTRIALMLVAGFLMAGERVHPTPPVDASPQHAEAPFDATAVGRVMGEANPALSLSERNRIGQAVMRCGAEQDLDPELVSAIILVESRARPWARSPKGAVGLMQVMPYMLESLELAGNFTTIESNIEAGCAILSSNIRRLGDEDGVSAYFWGSDIRSVTYLHRVRAARAEVRRLFES